MEDPLAYAEKDAIHSLNAPVRNFSTDRAILGQNGALNKFTRSKLIELRKKEVLPDMSYDLDGDGFVGGRDYVIARRFDNGFKNYLTPQEKDTALNALKNGYEDQFVWNVEASGAQRPYRILQKRGVIMDAEDHSLLTETYPKHPLSDKRADLKTRTELEEFRKQKEKKDIKEKEEANN